ncbi:MAG: DUF1697 domain-containing protein [Planctomycetes bacterium]|nr:DUF1697 domain-containing protein [Planctomycetota bacterium]
MTVSGRTAALGSTRRFLALLRGINVGGRNALPMAELRALGEELGWSNLRTYIQSGNLVFAAKRSGRDVERRLEDELEAGLARRCAWSVPVIVRGASRWTAYVRGNPFAAAAEATPNLVMLGLSKELPSPDAPGVLMDRARDGEQIALVGDALWIHFPGGVARSKLAQALLDRVVGSPVTMRNWNTVRMLGEMVGA